ncbi:MAG: acetyl-CoA carboxylase biotin carboxylase subunit [Candidatus Kariarchaeaceae archaeon]
MTKIEKVLIANRGEIAVRAVRTANSLGIKTVVVYSRDDQDSLHVRLADNAVYLGSGSVLETYLNTDKLIEACEQTGADSFYPGYGFLSENPDFARRVAKEGFNFIGPSADVIDVMGNKVSSRKEAKKAGIPIIPGSEEAIDDVSKAIDICEKIGYPVIVKAAFGGGGMGMVIVESKDDLEQAVHMAQEQAKAAFGRSEVFVEKYLINPKHIEIQFFGDKHGNVVHLGERECSIQRRHQKLLEEAPSPVVSPVRRAYLGNLVADFAKGVGYENAGTAEFLFKDGQFYFNEVNARIQVEMGVTEFVTGYDLVVEQFKVASGEPLSFNQKQVDIRGHSIEIRITAEDPLHDFRPSPGQVTSLIMPGGTGLRLDTHLYQGYTVPSRYDSMVGKLIAWDLTRSLCRHRLLTALDEFKISGFPTNMRFHRFLLEDDSFVSGTYHTGTIEERGLLKKVKDEFHAQAVALLAFSQQSSQATLPKPPSDNWKVQGRRESTGWSV